MRIGVRGKRQEARKKNKEQIDIIGFNFIEGFYKNLPAVLIQIQTL